MNGSLKREREKTTLSESPKSGERGGGFERLLMKPFLVREER